MSQGTTSAETILDGGISIVYQDKVIASHKEKVFVTPL